MPDHPAFCRWIVCFRVSNRTVILPFRSLPFQDVHFTFIQEYATRHDTGQVVVAPLAFFDGKPAPHAVSPCLSMQLHLFVIPVLQGFRLLLGQFLTVSRNRFFPDLIGPFCLAFYYCAVLSLELHDPERIRKVRDPVRDPSQRQHADAPGICLMHLIFPVLWIPRDLLAMAVSLPVQ